MVDLIDQLKITLKQHGYSLTHARQIVFEALQDSEPQTMPNIVAACQGKADRASVYRSIVLFESLGIVQRLHNGWKYQLELSDTFSHHHHHLTCSGCGLIIPLHEDQRLENRLRILAHNLRFKPESHQIEIRGLCHACASARSL